MSQRPQTWQKQRPQRVAVTTNCDDDNDKEADGSDEEHVMAAKRDFKH
jgi:hypothetical protein